MKYLGIDFGTKRVGIALSDAGGQIAFPKCVWVNDKNLFSKLEELLKTEKVECIVLGDSLNQVGEENKINQEIKKFSEKLKEQTNLPILFEKEFFSSFEAHFRRGKERFYARKNKINKTKNLDAKSATVILQRYLDHNFR